MLESMTVEVSVAGVTIVRSGPPPDRDLAFPKEFAKRMAEIYADRVDHLSQEQLEVAKRMADLEIGNGRRDIAGWPEGAPRQYNGGNVPCDMWSGTCACGAWHEEGK